MSFNFILCLVSQLCLTLCYPMDCSPPSSSVHGDSPGKNTGVACYVLLQGIFPTLGSIGSPALQVDSLLSEPPGKSKNTGVGSLSLLKPGDLSDPGIEPGSPALQVDSLVHCNKRSYMIQQDPVCLN